MEIGGYEISKIYRNYERFGPKMVSANCGVRAVRCFSENMGMRNEPVVGLFREVESRFASLSLFSFIRESSHFY
jgi:hypothetical protein